MKAAHYHSDDLQRGLISEDLLNFRWLDDIALSPDGALVAYTVRQPLAAINGYSTRAYLRDLASGTTECLTPGIVSAHSPAWSRDGAKLAFGCTEDGAHGVRIWSREDGSTRSLAIAGEAFGARSPVKVHSPTFYYHLALAPGASASLPDDYPERAAYVVLGTVESDGRRATAATVRVTNQSGQLVALVQAASLRFDETIVPA